MFHLNKRIKHWVNISDYMPLHCDPVITSTITCLLHCDPVLWNQCTIHISTRTLSNTHIHPPTWPCTTHITHTTFYFHIFHIQTGHKWDQAFLGSTFVAQLPTHPTTSHSHKAHASTYLHSQKGCCGQGSSTQVCTGRRFDPEPAPCTHTAAPQSQCHSRPVGSRESPWHQQGCNCTLHTQNVS